MAENEQSPAQRSKDLVSLDDVTRSPLESGSGSSSQDSIINAAEMFQQQLDQMTTWKQQIAQQMESMRNDGVKLLERQRLLAGERKKLAEERELLAVQREQIVKLQTDVDAESKRLGKRASEIEQTQSQLSQLQAQREQAERELGARQRGLAEQEARHLAEDIRLKQGLEELESQRRQLVEAQRQAVHDRETLAAQARDLDGRAHALEQQNQSLSGREHDVQNARQHNEQAQSAVQSRQQELARQEAELQAHRAELQAAQQQLAEERQGSAKLRQELQHKLEAFETEHAEQLETLAKQTKRLSERRAAFEAAESDVEKALASRIASATEALKEELNRTRNGQQERINQLEEQIQQAEAAARSWQSRETQLQQDLGAATAQLGKIRDELRAASTSVERVSAERSSLAQQLSQQIEAAKQEAAKWQQAIDAARAQSSGGDKALQEAQTETSAARKELDALKQKHAQLQTAKDELEFQLEVRTEDQTKSLDALRQELTAQITERDAQISQWKQKLELAQQAIDALPAGKPGSKDSQKIKDAAKQIQMFQQQRDELASQLFAAQDALRRQQEESLLSKNAMEGKLLELKKRNTTLESEKASWKTQRPAAGSGDPQAAAQAQTQADWHRQRLLRQAKALRMFRQQIRETQTSLSTGRDEIAQQREQLRARKENLEQVKRLLEKQEMVMARKLADHNAVKTVAAVGIFVIMVLGSVFFGVYRFVHPLYRSEAVVQLAAPQNLQGGDLDAWLGRQIEFMKSSEVKLAAWKVLRSADEHYSMHDVREEWIASLNNHLSLALDAGTKSLSIRYTGPDAEGVSQVCNALATVYTTPGVRDYKEDTKSFGLGSQVLAKATVPQYPLEDNRISICLTGVAGTLLVSLLLVIIFRHFIARQLKEIDQMADAQDLEEIRAEMPDGAKPAVE